MSKARDLADFVSDGNPLADGTISVSEVSGAAPTASPTFTGDATFDTDTLVVDSTNNRVGIGTSSPNRSLEVYNASAQAPMRVESGQGTAYIDFKTSGTTADFKVGLGAINDDAYFRAGGTERMRIDSSGNVGIGATNSSVFNGVGGNSRIVAKGSDTATNVVNNSNASITIANDDGTANNLAGLHFARADTDDNPHYAGASIVAQFPIAQVTGQYPQGQLVFLTSTSQNAAPSEKLRISPEGAVGIGGANYGTAGQVLTSGGSGAAPSWQSVSFTTNVITGNTTATANNHYYLNAAGITLTLPASPSVGDEVRISEVAGNTDCIIGRNGSNIMSSGTDLTIDTGYTVIYLRYVDATIGWAFS